MVPKRQRELLTWQYKNKVVFTTDKSQSLSGINKRLCAVSQSPGKFTFAWVAAPSRLPCAPESWAKDCRRISDADAWRDTKDKEPSYGLTLVDAGGEPGHWQKHTYVWVAYLAGEYSLDVGSGIVTAYNERIARVLGREYVNTLGKCYAKLPRGTLSAVVLAPTKLMPNARTYHPQPQKSRPAVRAGSPAGVTAALTMSETKVQVPSKLLTAGSGPIVADVDVTVKMDVTGRGDTEEEAAAHALLALSRGFAHLSRSAKADALKLC